MVTLNAEGLIEMQASDVDGLKRSREEGLERIAFANPPRNLLAPELINATRDAILEADADDEVTAIAVTGEGEVFCGGLDVARIREGADPVEFAAALVELLRIFPALGKPIIAAVNGDALAGGYGLVCAADIAIAADHAKLGTFEATVGLWPMIAQVPAVKRLHPRHALENILTGEPFDARRAQEVGIVNRAVPAQELWDEVKRWAQLAVRAGPALAAGRRSFYRFADLSYDEALTGSLEAFRDMFAGAEGATR